MPVDKILLVDWLLTTVTPACCLFAYITPPRLRLTPQHILMTAMTMERKTIKPMIPPTEAPAMAPDDLLDMTSIGIVQRRCNVENEPTVENGTKVHF